MYGSTTTIPFTLGASTALTVLSVSAATAATTQCINGALRVYGESEKPALLDYYDSQEWYSTAMRITDQISLAGATAAGAISVKLVTSMSRQGITSRKALQGLNRSERKRFTEEIIQMNHPHLSNKMRKALIRAGIYPKRYSNLEITKTARTQLIDAIAASLTFAGSFLSGELRNLAIGIHKSL